MKKVLEFCSGVFLSADPEVHESVAPRLDQKLLDPAGPIVSQEEIERLVPDDIEAQLVLKEINSRKSLATAFSSIGGFSDEITAGFAARVTRGNIGLIGPPKAMTNPLSSKEMLKMENFSLYHLLLLLFAVIPAVLFYSYSAHIVA